MSFDQPSGHKKKAMLARTLSAIGIALTLAGQACAINSQLDVQLFPLTGDIRLHNPDPAAVPFVFYQIKSSSNTSGALNPSSAVWKSITEKYDAPTGPTPGNGFIDPVNQWTKLSSTSTQLTEGLLAPPPSAGSLAAFRTVDLGRIWNPNVVGWQDLAFEVSQDSGPLALNIQLAVDGDYDHSGSVNDADYAIWRKNFGSTTALNADGNFNGIVDDADYAVWRANFGQALPGSGLSLGPSAVPEPQTASLLAIGIVALIALASTRRAARRAVCPCAVRR
jgi:hypothetical protein